MNLLITLVMKRVDDKTSIKSIDEQACRSRTQRRDPRRLARQSARRRRGRHPHEGPDRRGIGRHGAEVPLLYPRHAEDGFLLRRDSPQGRKRQVHLQRAGSSGRPKQSRLEVRYSPTLAGAMVDALPYLVDYPYGCTEQTLNRFLPTVITQKVLLDMKLDLKDIQEKRTNLNAQEIGSDARSGRSSGSDFDRNPVFDEDEVRKHGQGRRRAAHGDAAFRRRLGLVLRLGRALLAAHHGLRGPRPANRPAKRRGPGARRVGARRRVAETLPGRASSTASRTRRSRTSPQGLRWKDYADNLDAFVYMVLVDAGVKNADMLEFLYRDRTKLSVYAHGHVRHRPGKTGREGKARHDHAQHRPVRPAGRREPDGLAQPARRLLVVLVRQRVRGPRLLSQAACQDRSQGRVGRAARQVSVEQSQARHLLELDARHGLVHRGHGRLHPRQRRGPSRNMTVEVYFDGKLQKAVEITPKNLFTFDNKFVLEGDDVATGQHTGRTEEERHRPAVLQRLPHQLHPGRLHHQGRTGDQGQPQVLQAGQGRQVDQGRRLARPGGRSEGREVRSPGIAQPGRRSRAATWWRSNWRSTARTTTSTWSSRT